MVLTPPRSLRVFVFVVSLLGLSACTDHATVNVLDDDATISDPDADATSPAEELSTPQVDAASSEVIDASEASEGVCSFTLRWWTPLSGYGVYPGFFEVAPSGGWLSNIQPYYNDYGQILRVEDGIVALTPDPDTHRPLDRDSSWSRLLVLTPGQLEVRDHVTDETLRASPFDGYAPSQARFSADDALVAGAICDGVDLRFQVWDLDAAPDAEPETLRIEQGCLARFTEVKIAPAGGDAFIVSPGDAVVHLIETHPLRITATARLDGEPRGILALAPRLRSDGVGTLALVDDVGEVTLRALPSLERQRGSFQMTTSWLNSNIYAPQFHVAPIAWSPDGAHLAHAAPEGEIIIRDAQLNPIEALTAPENIDVPAWGENLPVSIAWLPDGRGIGVMYSYGVAMHACDSLVEAAPPQVTNGMGPRTLPRGVEGAWGILAEGDSTLVVTFEVNGEVVQGPGWSTNLTWVFEEAGEHTITALVDSGLAVTRVTHLVSVSAP